MHWNDRIVVITIPVVGPTCKVNFYQPELTDGFQQQLLVGFIFLHMAKHFPFHVWDVILPCIVGASSMIDNDTTPMMVKNGPSII